MKRLTLVLALLIATALGTSTGAHAGDALSETTTKGPVAATVSLKPQEPLIGDTVTLTLRVDAGAKVEVLMPEFGEALERYRVIDFVPRERQSDSGDTTYTQRYTLMPPSSGPQSIPPLLIEFVDRRTGEKPAPEGLDAYEILTERLDFTVKSVLPDSAQAQLKPPLGELAAIEPPSAPLWPWLAGLLLMLLALAPWAGKRYSAWRRLARRRSAYDVASSRLDRLMSRPAPDQDGNVDEYYVELSGIVRRYLELRFELRAPEMSTEEFLEAVSRSPDLGQEHQRLLREFLRDADLVKFAHAAPTAAQNHAAATAVRKFLDETREDAPLLNEKDAARMEKLEEVAHG